MDQGGSNNWIKVQRHTPSKPELRALARACNVSRGDAFLAWFRLYTYLDEVCDDGYVRHLTAEDVDEEAGLEGTAQAFAQVGWLAFDADGCAVANWNRHNGKSAKRRAVDAERQARHRQASR